MPNAGLPRGVRREHPKCKKYMVQIVKDKKWHYITGFDTIEEAEVAFGAAWRVRDGCLKGVRTIPFVRGG